MEFKGPTDQHSRNRAMLLGLIVYCPDLGSDRLEITRFRYLRGPPFQDTKPTPEQITKLKELGYEYIS
ncbi:MAG: hypothetical protein J4469_02490 [Candidatus Aenigmarchaeota archaeon]|nr:hypothetical protein [Candidatus Aenigmarchaeota archaeon]